jgi:uncharacterized membrane protein YozB (DUF420 family)
MISRLLPMTINEPVTASRTADALPPQRNSGPPRQRAWWRRPWIAPLAVGTAAFLIYVLPPYLGLDPAKARLPLPPAAIYYPVLVIHIFAGSILLACATLQVWPWLRRRHLRVHRWSGRIYVLAAIPVGVGGLIVAQFPHGGPVQQAGNTAFGLLFLTCTGLGYRAVRQHRIGDHRRWMIRSFALAFSIVTNRIWLMIMIPVFASTGGDQAVIAVIGAATWISWLVNLAVAEWWLRRRRRPLGAGAAIRPRAVRR